ncbi:MAG: CapA family protein [Candidatus Hydrogenedentes bacterium]|nr:CapA family protein [Candidatus Hydrogenedentota bacterium]
MAGEAQATPATLIFGGDVMLAANLPPFAPYNPAPLPYAFLFERIAPFIRGADLAFCNLENPISGRGKRLNKEFAFNAPPDAAQALANADFDAVSLANNHCLDFGEEALSDTLAHLAGADVQYAGIAPQTPTILEAKGLRVALLSYLASPVYPAAFGGFATQPAMADKERMLTDVADARERADFIVVALHWGYDFSPHHDSAQETLAHALIDAGVHVVAGHHPHVQQEVEYYRNGLVFYSMGNPVFAQYSKPVSRKTRLYRVQAARTGVVSAEYLPVEIQESGQPKPLADTFMALPR